MTGHPVVRAAGCVLWRPARSGGACGGGAGIELALVHRPKYDDWSHPKGKLERAEAADPAYGALRAAVREVREETGMECAPGAPLSTLRYVADGCAKEVRYWAAEATGGLFVPNAEVDRLVWLPPEGARARLTYARDRPLVDALLATLGGRRSGSGSGGP